ESAKQRLNLWNISSKEIAELEKTRKAREHLTLYSPFKGVVQDIGVDQGRKVMNGDHLVDIADLSVVWVWAQFYQDELPMLKKGLPVVITMSSYPGEKLDGKISVIDPFINDAMRTGRVRIDVENAGLKLRPDMYVDVELTMHMGEGVAVPVAAVLPTGKHHIAFLVVILTVFGIAGGIWALNKTPLDAIPDLSDVQVIVYTEWEGRSPDLVEDQITYPISTRFIAAPKVKFVRGESMFGKSFIYVIFEDGTDIYWARSRVIEYLSSVKGMLPEGVNPVIGPDATGVGWVYEYALVDKTGKHNLAQLRSFQDWNLRYALESVKGVSEVAPVGG